MVVYNVHSGQFTHQFCSKHVSTAERILLSANLMVTVEMDKVIIWRLQPVTGLDVYDTYLNDVCRNDDERDSDESYYDDYDDDKRHDVLQQRIFTTLSGQEVYSVKQDKNTYRSRYVLDLKTSANAIELTANQLVVGSSRGLLLMFNLGVFDLMKEADVYSENYEVWLGGRLRKCGCQQPKQDSVEPYGELSKSEPVFCTTLPEVKHTGPISVVCVSNAPRERYIVCGSTDHTLTVFDRLRNARQVSLIGHSDQVLCACVSSCDKFVVSGSADSSIRIWHLTTGNSLAIFDACVDVFQVNMWEDDDCQPRVAALGDKHGTRKLMLFKTHNINSTCSNENF